MSRSRNMTRPWPKGRQPIPTPTPPPPLPGQITKPEPTTTAAQLVRNAAGPRSGLVPKGPYLP